MMSMWRFCKRVMKASNSHPTTPPRHIDTGAHGALRPIPYIYHTAPHIQYIYGTREGDHISTVPTSLYFLTINSITPL